MGGVLIKGFPGGSDGKESACNAGDPRLIPGSGRSPREGNGYQTQASEEGLQIAKKRREAKSKGEKEMATHSSIPAF